MKQEESSRISVVMELYEKNVVDVHAPLLCDDFQMDRDDGTLQTPKNSMETRLTVNLFPFCYCFFYDHC